MSSDNHPPPTFDGFCRRWRPELCKAAKALRRRERLEPLGLSEPPPWADTGAAGPEERLARLEFRDRWRQELLPRLPRVRVAVPALVTATLIAACGPPSERASDVDAASETPPPSLAVDTAAGPSYRIGRVNTTNPFEIYTTLIRAVFVSESRIALNDAATNRISVIELDGTGIWQGGGKGEAPGYTRGLQVVGGRDGRVVVAGAEGELHFWDREGRLERATRVRRAGVELRGPDVVNHTLVAVTPEGISLRISREAGTHATAGVGAGGNRSATHAQWLEFVGLDVDLAIWDGIPPITMVYTTNESSVVGQTQGRPPLLKASMRDDVVAYTMLAWDTLYLADLDGRVMMKTPITSFDPFDVTVDYEGRIWMTALGGEDARVYSASGNLLFTITLNGLSFYDATSSMLIGGRVVDGVVEVHVYRIDTPRG